MARYELELTTENGLPVLASPKMLRERSIHIYFTTRQGGVSRPPFDTLNLAPYVGDEPDRVEANRRAALEALGLENRRLVTVRQVHDSNVEVVGKISKKTGQEDKPLGLLPADAIVTAERKRPIAVLTADCLPIILVDTKAKVISVVHVGWKGLYLGAVRKALVALQDCGGAAVETYAFLGPSIGSCCYDVKEERTASFPRAGTVKRGGRNYLDLRMIAREQLAEAGIGQEHVAVSDLCTYCERDLFFSFRRDGTCGRQAALAAIE